MVFDKDWFNKHNRKITWLANHSKTFRRDLGIQDCDVQGHIAQITPNSVTYIDPTYFRLRKQPKQVEFITDFRTHDKYAKRMYYGFYPIWDLAHKFDMSIANKWSPALNLGFDTLTKYPDADPETSTVDGYVQRVNVNESFSTIRNTADGNDAFDASAATNCPRIGTSGAISPNFSVLRRGILTFDTSSLTSVATVSGGTFSIYGNSKTSGLGEDAFHVASATPATNTSVSNGDYDAIGRTTFGNVAYASFATGGYNDITLNASGIANISKTGISGFSIQLGWDINNSFGGVWADSAVTNFNITFADQDGTTQDPKLVVTYTLPATFIPQIIFI